MGIDAIAQDLRKNPGSMYSTKLPRALLLSINLLPRLAKLLQLTKNPAMAFFRSFPTPTNRADPT